MARLFCYGTLQIPEVITTVTGTSFAGVPARLDGYACYRVKDAHYPGVVPCADKNTEGVLYTGIEEKDLQVLDRFEGSLYERQLLKTVTLDGHLRSAWVYVTPSAKAKQLTNQPWFLQDFLNYDMEAFMQQYVHARRDVYR